MSFRTKLLCVVAVPVIGLVAVGGLAASEGVDSTVLAVIAVATALMSVLVGLIVARRVANPLQQLTLAAGALASDQLPALVEGIAAPSDDDHRYLSATMQPLEIQTDDEIGQLARAFNAIQTVAVDAAAEQATLLRKGIADLFVNLARRNQVLLDRQIALFDELEAAEDDPDQLAQLYRLDQLATRMRRNAESMLVLAGVEPARRRAQPVAMLDVLRAAVGEIEDFARIDVGDFDEAEVHGTVAVDLGHLLAELLENAAQLSPPETRVTVEGRLGRGGYQLAIRDMGVGMTAEVLTAANTLLASPPPVGMSMGRTLGLTVVARLAARHGISVQLTTADTGGVCAVVTVPSRITVVPVVEDTEGAPSDTRIDAGVDAESHEPTATREGGAGYTQLDEADFDELVRSAWAEDAGEPPVDDDDDALDTLPRRQPQHLARDDAPPAQLSEALPTGPAFEHGLRQLALGDEVLGPPTLIEPSVPKLPRVEIALPTVEDDEDDDDDLPEIIAADPTTVEPLTRRVAQPPSAPPVPPVPPGVAAIRPSSRSPEEVRSMLARYRKGVESAQAGDAPPDESIDWEPEDASGHEPGEAGAASA
jgi:signal transduction histidine kinase